MSYDNLMLKRPWRCDVTGNPVGTDTQRVGYTCDCQGCRAESTLAKSEEILATEIEGSRQAYALYLAAQEEIERLRKALEPFAALTSAIPTDHRCFLQLLLCPEGDTSPTGDWSERIRAAARALASTQPEHGGRR